MPPESARIRVTVREKIRLSESSFELHLERPADFSFLPGQKIVCRAGDIEREYTLVSAPADDHLAICVKKVAGGKLSTFLSEIRDGDSVSISDPRGFFLFQERPALFLATGTGIAPFVSYARSGVGDFHLLHGVSSSAELIYRELFAGSAQRYIPCISRADDVTEPGGAPWFNGRVTGCLQQNYSSTLRDIYLCGNGGMIHDAIQIVDRMLPQSRVYTETFF